MNRWKLAACVLALGVVASTPAAASYKVIRWTSGICQIWDNAIPTMPFPGDWRAVSRNHRTYMGAVKAEQRLVRHRKCGW